MMASGLKYMVRKKGKDRKFLIMMNHQQDIHTGNRPSWMNRYLSSNPAIMLIKYIKSKPFI